MRNWILMTFLLAPFLMAHARRADAVAEDGFVVSSDDTSVTVAVVDGRPVVRSLVCRADGFDWVGGSAAELPFPLIDSAEVGGKSRTLHWRLAAAPEGDAGAEGERALAFACDEPALSLTCSWEGHAGPGPVEQRVVIVNRGKEPVLLPVQASLVLGMRSAAGHGIEQWWVDKGAGTPTADGTHRQALAPAGETLLRCWPSGRDNPRDPIPWTAIQDVDGGRGLYAGVEFTARVQISLSAARAADTAPAGPPGPAGTALRLRVGLQEDPQAPFFTRVMPGESFEAPPVFIGCYRGDVDDGANRLRRWVRKSIVPPASDARYPLLVNNTWGNGMAVDEALSRRMIDDAAALGLEMFHIDAGWFRSVGDWSPDRAKFPAGLAPIADYAHGKGLKFGLWVGWTQGGERVDPAGGRRILSVNDPAMAPWFCQTYAADWKATDFSGATVCLGEPRAADWCLDSLRSLIKDARLDMLEHDQTMVCDGCQQTGHLHTQARADAGYRAAQGYYRVYDTLRKENPGLLFENCVNGGHMIDYGALRRCHYISITDTYDPLSNRRALYDASYALPPAACECYVQNVPVKGPAQFRYMLRSGMMGWCTIMADTTRWTARQHDEAKKEIAVYKERLRPLIRVADLYHVTARPDETSWDAIEYYDPRSGKGAVFVFRGKNDETEHAVALKGLDPAAKYALSWQDGSSPPEVVTGQELINAGVRLKLAEPETSDILHFLRQ